VKINISILALMLTCGFSHQAYSCTCGHLDIEKEVGRAYDIVVGKIVSERADEIVCEYSLNNKTYDSYTSIAYGLAVEFSYKGKLNATTTILGGKGGGDCGGIFHPGNEYLIVVYECDKGYYTFLCSDNALKSEASTQVEFLNVHFEKNYQIDNSNFSIGIILFVLILILISGLLTVNFFKRRFGKNIGSDLG
jgi:hypothetical protein